MCCFTRQTSVQSRILGRFHDDVWVCLTAIRLNLGVPVDSDLTGCCFLIVKGNREAEVQNRPSAVAGAIEEKPQLLLRTFQYPSVRGIAVNNAGSVTDE